MSYLLKMAIGLSLLLCIAEVIDVIFRATYGKPSNDKGFSLSDCKWKHVGTDSDSVPISICIHPLGKWHKKCPKKCRYKRFTNLPEYATPTFLWAITKIMSLMLTVIIFIIDHTSTTL